jgi:hypothetical protein
MCLLVLLTGAATAIATTLSSPAEAKGPAPQRCTAAYGEGQELARMGRLRDARASFLKCAQAACGSAQKKCAAAADSASAELAQVAFVVSDSADAPLVDVLVKMDGETLTRHLDGHALAIDPGVHEFTFGARVGDPDSYVWLTRRIMIVQGQREPISVALPTARNEAGTFGPSDEAATLAARQLDADAKAASASASASKKCGESSTDDEASSDDVASEKGAKDPAAHETPILAYAESSPSGRGRSAWPWVTGSIGLLGVGAGGYLAYLERKDNDALARCAPDCKEPSVALARQTELASEVSFAAGGALVGLGVLLLATSHSHDDSPTVGSAGPTRFTLDLRPARSGGFAALVGVF